MASKQIGVDGGLPANLAGMTKSQLYDIMSQMKALIDQNHEQAREILIRNPLLTKALFQAQIMLGMVQPPQVIPKVEPQQPPPKPNVQPRMSSVQGGSGLQEPTMQPQVPIRKHPTQQQPMPMPPPPPPPSVSTTNNAQPQPRFSHPQRQGHMNPAAASLSHQQSSQVQNAPPPPPVPHHPTSQQPPFHHLDIPASSTQLHQQPMHSAGGSHLAQQQPRPYHHQFGPSQTGPNTGFQHHNAPPQHHSQPAYHSSNRPAASGGPQFPQGQPHLPSQPSYQSQGGSQYRGDYNNNQLGGPMAVDRGSSWMSGQSESSNITHLPGLGPVPSPNQVGPGGGGPPPRPAAISPEMEKTLLQQVMSLTPEQINLLPPEQRNQVFQLQQMLRQ